MVTMPSPKRSRCHVVVALAGLAAIAVGAFALFSRAHAGETYLNTLTELGVPMHGAGVMTTIGKDGVCHSLRAGGSPEQTHQFLARFDYRNGDARAIEAAAIDAFCPECSN
ncbi:Protein of unknown function (DUF732) [Prauserella sp. Am3]|nr:Protein of unknown function (DUF732) [Prauserella sp. Am3]